jgi:ABC-type oligopeptide transport system ATPase subunit
MRSPSLELRGVTRFFGDLVAVDELSFSVPAGHLFGFVGRNGAGKTTTMRIICGLLAADGGGVSWRDAPIDARVRERIGYMPEERGLYPKICDNYGTHKSPAIRRWLDAHPRFHMHHTPTYSSWVNQVERWFAYITDDLLRRSDHRSVQALEKDIRDWVAAWNENPKPFIWTKTAEQILESLSRLLQRINGAGH